MWTTVAPQFNKKVTLRSAAAGLLIADEAIGHIIISNKSRVCFPPDWLYTYSDYIKRVYSFELFEPTLVSVQEAIPALFCSNLGCCLRASPVLFHPVWLFFNYRAHSGGGKEADHGLQSNLEAGGAKGYETR